MRTLTCFRCVHRGQTEGSQKTCYCKLTSKKGSINRGYTCEKFERIETESHKTPVDGYLRRNLQVEDYRTAKQWEEAGRGIKEGVEGHRMYANGSSSRTFVYYLPEETYSFDECLENKPKNCMTCSIRDGRYCVVAGDYVSSKNCCSEWTS